MCVSTWAQECIEKLVKGGVMSGRANGEFDSKSIATRGETAKIIYGITDFISPKAAA